MRVHYKFGLPFIYILLISKCCTHPAPTSQSSSIDYDYKDDYDDDDLFYSEDTNDDNDGTTLNTLNIEKAILLTSTNSPQIKIEIPKRSNHVVEPSCPRQCLCLKDYKHIQCSNAKLTDIPHDIPRTAIVIDLSQNRFTNIKSSDFANFTKLIEINLSDNFLTEIPKDVFEKNTRLQRLNFANNRLTYIGPDTFITVPELSALDLSNNSIELRNQGSFLNQPQLLELSCQNCSWTQLYDETFHNLSSLTALRLDQNDFHKKINTLAFTPLRNLIKLRLPVLEQQSVTKLCNLLKSIDNISFRHFDVSCFELVLGTSFNDSLILTTDPPFIVEPLAAKSVVKNNIKPTTSTKMETPEIYNLDEVGTSSNMTLLTSVTNDTINDDADIVGSTTATVKKAATDEAYQVNVSQEAINIMLISIMVIAMIGIAIGLICRKDIGGIKTKCCRTKKEEPKEDAHPTEEIPLNKLA